MNGSPLVSQSSLAGSKAADFREAPHQDLQPIYAAQSGIVPKRLKEREPQSRALSSLGPKAFNVTLI